MGALSTRAVLYSSSSSSSTATPHLGRVLQLFLCVVVRSAQRSCCPFVVVCGLGYTSLSSSIPHVIGGIYQHNTNQFHTGFVGEKKERKTRKVIHTNLTFSVDFALVLLLIFSFFYPLFLPFANPSLLSFFSLCDFRFPLNFPARHTHPANFCVDSFSSFVSTRSYSLTLTHTLKQIDTCSLCPSVSLARSH